MKARYKVGFRKAISFKKSDNLPFCNEDLILEVKPIFQQFLMKWSKKCDMPCYTYFYTFYLDVDCYAI